MPNGKNRPKRGEAAFSGGRGRSPLGSNAEWEKWT
jgi:hypothetical protein